MQRLRRANLILWLLMVVGLLMTQPVYAATWFCVDSSSGSSPARKCSCCSKPVSSVRTPESCAKCVQTEPSYAAHAGHRCVIVVACNASQATISQSSLTGSGEQPVSAVTQEISWLTPRTSAQSLFVSDSSPPCCLTLRVTSGLSPPTV